MYGTIITDGLLILVLIQFGINGITCRKPPFGLHYELIHPLSKPLYRIAGGVALLYAAGMAGILLWTAVSRAWPYPSCYIPAAAIGAAVLLGLLLAIWHLERKAGSSFL